MSATITPTASTRAGSGTAAEDAVARRVDDQPVEKWSARRTIAFVTLVCGVFWVGVAALVVALIRAL